MATADDLAGVARAIIDGNAYLTLATADADGRPWASPVWFAPDGYAAFLWVSAQDTRHSRNLALRSDVGIAIFDSTVPIGTGQAVYAEAVAACLSGAEIERGIALFSQRSLAHGGRAWSVADVEAPDGLRLYRATATGHWILDQADDPAGGRAGDHRIAVHPAR
jgi:hypothetical protein